MTAENRRSRIIVLEEAQDRILSGHMTQLSAETVKRSDLSGEEAGDPVPEVGLTGAAQEPETPPQRRHSQTTTSQDGTTSGLRSRHQDKYLQLVFV